MEEIVFLVFTIIVELPIALALLKCVDDRCVALLVVGLNLISHPIFWELVYGYGMNWFFIEACVAVFEALTLAIMFRKKWLLAAGTGLIMNFTTAAIGYIFF
ncbi:MAG: hypothetical protein Q8P30_01715 [Candidatus Uhrbacteria bacterium]|nr:hypothetical protein [Candidatus Uhrbacteria bacterium]